MAYATTNTISQARVPGVPSASAAAKMHQAVPDALHKKRVLVVDDDLDGALMLGMLLRRMGYEVVTTDNGQDALGWGSRLHPEVVLLDLAMPGMDGFELCRELRKQNWGEHVTVIAITGLDDARDRMRSQAAGFDLHLVKPVNPDVLDRELRSAPSL
jgi:DNA-binding response OmpR family regulator